MKNLREWRLSQSSPNGYPISHHVGHGSFASGVRRILGRSDGPPRHFQWSRPDHRCRSQKGQLIEDYNFELKQKKITSAVALVILEALGTGGLLGHEIIVP